MTDEQIRKIAGDYAEGKPTVSWLDIYSKLTGSLSILTAAGFAVVPVEPTEEMGQGGAKVLISERFPGYVRSAIEAHGGFNKEPNNMACRIYRAMLRAAPLSTQEE